MNVVNVIRFWLVLITVVAVGWVLHFAMGQIVIAAVLLAFAAGLMIWPILFVRLCDVASQIALSVADTAENWKQTTESKMAETAGQQIVRARAVLRSLPDYAVPERLRGEVIHRSDDPLTARPARTEAEARRNAEVAMGPRAA